METSELAMWTRRRLGVGAASVAALAGLSALHGADAKKKRKKKKKKNNNNNNNPPPPANPDATGTLVRSAKAVSDACIAGASGTIQLFKLDGAEKMVVNVSGLPANTEFDVFIIENPDNPFGFSWYQGDLETNGSGSGSQTFIGRFNDETFILDDQLIPVAHPTFHVGVWFNDKNDAASAGCSNDQTPFNGEQNAGIQALKTVPVGGFGPLKQLS
ncbi:MAG: hypothetical protein QM692_08590 [Thermomicrobiales bacterium]